MNITKYFSKELFKGKTVFVTGGGSGINLGIARNFATLGANIGICGRTQAKLDTAAVELRTLGAKVCPVAADVRDFAALETIPLMALHRNAGCSQPAGTRQSRGRHSGDLRDAARQWR